MRADGRRRVPAPGLVVGLTLLAVVAAAGARAEEPSVPPPCDAVEGFHRLDFWLGEWRVLVGEQEVGRNRIEKILDGCAVTERWSATGGGEGRSLFTYHVADDTWSQVWVTARATATGGVKEKRTVEAPEGSLRFQGRVAVPGGGAYLDRTTLTPLEGGRVRQWIEISRDDGATWRTVFDAVYVPAGE